MGEFDEQAAQESIADEPDESDITSDELDDEDDALDLESLGEFDEQAAQESIADEPDESDITSDELDDEDDALDLESLPEFELESDDEATDKLISELDDTADEEQTDDEIALDEAAIEEEFMSDLTQSDFDSLLNELAEPEPIERVELDEVDVDFESLLQDEEGISDVEGDEQQDDQDDEQFVDIDELLAQSDDFELEDEPYSDPDMDVGLSEFDDLLAGENATDVDLEEEGYSAKLDLARAYIEIEDYDSANKVIEEVISNGPQGVQQEAGALQSKIKGNL
ncbi:FimV/HubP family polar landmark protein [Pseudoalteromonas byunsanensis]